MFYTYVLQNKLTKKYYIGATNDVDRRIKEHNRGQTTSTRSRGRWILAYIEKYLTSKEAKCRERQIKSYKGGNAFKKMLMRE